MLGTGDAIWFSDGNGHPPCRRITQSIRTTPGTPAAGYTSALSEIENPNPQPGTNNYYTQDGYGGGSGSPTAVAPNANYGGGSYVDCSDPTAARRRSRVELSQCARPQGQPAIARAGTTICSTTTIRAISATAPTPTPTPIRAIMCTRCRRRACAPSAIALDAKNISWAYYGDQFNRYLNDKYEISCRRTPIAISATGRSTRPRS